MPRRGQLLISLEAAQVSLGGATVLAGVTLALRAGDRLALLGANGSGKSTLLRLLRGDQWLDPAHPGRRTFHWPDGASASPIGARERMALVGPEDQDGYLRREQDLPVEAVIRSGLDGALYPVEGPTPARRARVLAAARAMGVVPLLGRSFLTLSRGEGRKVLVARALAAAPRGAPARRGLRRARRREPRLAARAARRGGGAGRHGGDRGPPGRGALPRA